MLLPVLAVLYLLGFTNLFLRSSFGVMGPDIGREMALSPAMLSGVASAFFFAYAAMQIPTGIFLDRFGARTTLAGMMLFTAIGAGLFAWGKSVEVLMLARVLMGIGCAGVFTGAFYVMARWLPQASVVAHIGYCNTFATFGTLCATAPLAALIAWIGWRQSYWLFTGAVGVLAVLLALMVRDAPPGAVVSSARKERFGEVMAGVVAASRNRDIRRLLVMGLPISAASTLTGAWGAPYLRDVHGLDDLARGKVLLVMALSGMAGHTVLGVLAREFNSVKLAVITGTVGVSLLMAALAALTMPPIWLVVAVFSALALCASFPTVVFAHARGLVPAEQMGRGVSVTNTGIMAAIAVMQLVFGWVLGLLTTGPGPISEYAYRAGFALQAVVAVLALVIYLPVRDVKPKG
jgi:MFS family permease